MRASLTGLSQPTVGASVHCNSAASGPVPDEWMIVSRWGADLEYLSLARTSRHAASGEAPISLVPSRTALARRDTASAKRLGETYVLLQSLPDRVVVAGKFDAAEGLVRLYGNRQDFRLRARGRRLDAGFGAAWHCRARRAPWIGEFIEPTLPADKPIGFKHEP